MILCEKGDNRMMENMGHSMGSMVIWSAVGILFLVVLIVVIVKLWKK